MKRKLLGSVMLVGVVFASSIAPTVAAEAKISSSCSLVYCKTDIML